MHSTKQIFLKTHTLEQTMQNKVEAFLDRGEIRDCFDLEFLLRRGMAFPQLDDRQVKVFEKKLAGFKEKDYKVTLGSIPESGDRDYYIKTSSAISGKLCYRKGRGKGAGGIRKQWSADLALRCPALMRLSGFSREATPAKKVLDFAPPLWLKYMHYKSRQEKRRGLVPYRSFYKCPIFSEDLIPFKKVAIFLAGDAARHNDKGTPP